MKFTSIDTHCCHPLIPLLHYIPLYGNTIWIHSFAGYWGRFQVSVIRHNVLRNNSHTCLLVYIYLHFHLQWSFQVVSGKKNFLMGKLIKMSTKSFMDVTEVGLESLPLSLPHPLSTPKRWRLRVEAQQTRCICQQSPIMEMEGLEPKPVSRSWPKKSQRQGLREKITSFSVLPGRQARDASVLVLLHIDCFWEEKAESLFLRRCLGGQNKLSLGLP